MKSDVEKLRVLNKLVEHYGYQNWWENENRIEDWVAMILIQRTTERSCHLALDNLEVILLPNNYLKWILKNCVN